MSIDVSKKGLSRVEELYKNRDARAREMKDEGEKIIGYLCSYTPVELMSAIDFIPYRITGDVEEPVVEADAYLETIMCPFVRSCFDLALKGKYDFLDGLVIPHSCDTIEKIYNIWRYHSPLPYFHFVNVPHMVTASSRQFFRQEIEMFKESLEGFAGRKITPEALSQAIEVHNKNRAMLRELYDLRKGDPPLISGTEITKLLVSGMTLPAVEFGQLISEVTDEVKDRQNPLESKPARIMIFGSEIDDIALVKLIEDAGSHVVTDDLCTGTRNFRTDVAITEDPLNGLADYYVGEIKCPRSYAAKKGNVDEDVMARFGYLLEYAKEFKVDGVILYVIRFCDTYELDVPDVLDLLEKNGLPVLHIETDYNLTAIGQLQTRVEAFLEMID